MKPNLFIVGGQKCGTTALASFLQQHPDICLVEGKEAHVFDSPRLQNVEKNIINEAYQAKLQHYSQQRYVCDATPIYCYLPGIMSRLASYSNNAKVIMLLRDPVDRAVSHYKMESRRGLEHRSMLRAFLIESARLKKCEDKLADHSPWRIHSYLDRGRYTQQLYSIYQSFDSEQVLILHNDDLRHHHQATLQRVFEFLDIAEHDIAHQEIFAGQDKKMGFTDKLALLLARFILRKDIQISNKYRFSTS
ncbi:sulfotransferase [Motilimonas sp. E26]|uniref:sulfotransferase family protein n=1 Tax=Motilimonas sp. E26 TaxID=2865674 RepID=UPI001E509118|nr:sulfotransferase [Motilimonas sp. E26]MCE0558545.1 sulfotransferase [Motilimonas sp. E26]